MTNISGVTRQIQKNIPKLKAIPTSATISLAASATTDGMEFTVSLRNAAGGIITGVHRLELWFSIVATGIGLTTTAYSGALTAVSTFGAILTALTAKKHVIVATNTAGVFKGLIVDSANSTGEYVAVVLPHTGQVFVSGPSLTNWEGA